MTLLVIIGALVWGGMFAASHGTASISGPLTVYVIAFALGYHWLTAVVFLIGRFLKTYILTAPGVEVLL